MNPEVKMSPAKLIAVARDRLSLPGMLAALAALLELVTFALPLFAPLRAALGLFLIFFAPGIAMVVVLRIPNILTLKLVGLSIGLSICISTIIAFVISFTPWGITANSIRIALALSVVALLATAIFIRRNDPIAQPLPQQANTSRLQMLTGRWYYFLSVAVLLSIISFFIYDVQRLPPSQPFNEFFILDSTGKSTAYETRLVIGRSASYTVNLANRNESAERYMVRGFLGGEFYTEAGPVILKSGESWEKQITVNPQLAPTPRTKLEFRLFVGDLERLDSKVYLWVEITQ